MNELETGGEKKPDKRRVLSRRALCIGAGGSLVMLGLGGLKFIEPQPMIRPPGGQDEARVVSACIHCEKCYESCPNNVIAPGHVEDGVLNIRTPTLNFKYSYCDWCEKSNNGYPLCVQVCPTDALHLPEGAEIFSQVIGKAELNKDRCLAYKMVGCGSCYKACPYEAMELDEVNRPYVLEDKCIGCGACEAACVSLASGSYSLGQTEQAIVVRALDKTGQIISRKSHRT